MNPTNSSSGTVNASSVLENLAAASDFGPVYIDLAPMLEDVDLSDMVTKPEIQTRFRKELGAIHISI